MPVHVPGLATSIIRDCLAATACDLGFPEAVLARIQSLSDAKIDAAWPAILKYLSRYDDTESDG